MSPAPTTRASRAQREGQVSEMLRDLLLPGRDGEVLAQVFRWVAPPREQDAADPLAGAMELFQPLWRAAQEDVLGARLVHLDTAGLPVLDASQDQRMGSLWRYLGDEQTALFLYTPTDENPGLLGPEAFLARRKGLVIARGSSRFETAFPRQGLIPCACNLLARRLFLKAHERGDLRSVVPLSAFQHLYEVEEDVREASPEARRASRQERSKPAYDELVDWCMKSRSDVAPSSPLGQAIHHVLDNVSALRCFLDDGTIPIDTDSFERLHGRETLVRKHPLLATNDSGAQRAAIASTLLGCCQLSSVNPAEYLFDVLPRLSQGMSPAEAWELLPSRWRASRRRALTGLGLGSY